MKSIGTKVLETDRLILRRFSIKDVNDMYNNWSRDEKVTRYVSFSPHKDVNETKTILSNWIERYDNNDSYNWAVELKSTHEVIGNISVINFSKIHQYCEVGYVYGSRYWGNGYATEVLRKVLEFLLNECEFNLVEAKHHASNYASGRVMQKAGMKKDGILRQRRASKTKDGYDDLVIYSIIKSEL